MIRVPKKDCTYYFLKLDYEIIKPLLVYKYDYKKMEREDEYVDLIMTDTNLLGSVYDDMEMEVIEDNNEEAMRERVQSVMQKLQDKR